MNNFCLANLLGSFVQLMALSETERLDVFWICKILGDMVLLMQLLLHKEHQSILRHRRPHPHPQCPQQEPFQWQLPRSHKRRRRLQWRSPSLRQQPPLHLRRHSQLPLWRPQHLRPRPRRFLLQQHPRRRLRRSQLLAPWQALRLRPPLCSSPALPQRLLRPHRSPRPARQRQPQSRLRRRLPLSPWQPQSPRQPQFQLRRRLPLYPWQPQFPRQHLPLQALLPNQHQPPWLRPRLQPCLSQRSLLRLLLLQLQRQSALRQHRYTPL